MRFKNLKYVLLAVVAIAFTAPSFAQFPPPATATHWRVPPFPDEMFNAMDANGDGGVTKEEFMAWWNSPMGPGGMGGPGEPGEPTGSIPPECSEPLRQAEQNPQATNVPASNGLQGNLLFRTVCDAPGFQEIAIALPSGRQAVDFDIEAITPGNVVFGIRVEGGPDVFHSSAGPTAFHSLNIADTAPSATGKYTVYLDTAASDPGSRVTVRFIDTPK